MRKIVLLFVLCLSLVFPQAAFAKGQVQDQAKAKDQILEQVQNQGQDQAPQQVPKQGQEADRVLEKVQDQEANRLPEQVEQGQKPDKAPEQEQVQDQTQDQIEKPGVTAETVEKLEKGAYTYSIIKDAETDEYTLVKEIKSKGKVVFETKLGEFEGKVNSRIYLKKGYIFVQFIAQGSIYFYGLNEKDGEIKRKTDFLQQIKKGKSPKKKERTKRKLMANAEQTDVQSTDAESRAENEAVNELEAISYLSITELTPTTVTLQYNKVVGAKKYRIYTELWRTEEKELVMETTSTTPTITNLDSDELFLVSVSAVHDKGESDEVLIGFWSSDGFPSVSVKAQQNSLEANWLPVDGVTNYEIELFGAWTEEPYGDNGSTVETNFTFNDLENNTPFGIIIKALNGKALYDQVTVVSMTYPYQPDPPQSLSFKQRTLSAGELKWEKSDTATEYQIFNGDKKIGTVGGNQPRFIVKGLKKGQEYRLGVVAANISGTSERSEITIEMGDSVDIEDPPPNTGDLPAPPNFKVTVNELEAELEWDRVEGAVGYALWVNGETKIDLPVSTSYVLRDLEEDMSYELHLRAIDEDGKDGYSSIVTFFTMSNPPEKPEVKIEKITSVSAYLTWEPVGRADYYIISYGGISSELLMENVKVKGLVENQTYEFTLVAANGAGESEPVTITIRTIPHTYTYTYAGSLLESVVSSYDKEWIYSYDKNGNTTNIKVGPVPEAEQEFDITKGFNKTQGFDLTKELDLTNVNSEVSLEGENEKEME